MKKDENGKCGELCSAYNLIGLRDEEKEDGTRVAVLKIEEKHLGEAEIEGRRVATGMFAFGIGNAAMGWEVTRFLSGRNKKAVIGTANIRFENPAKEGDILKVEGKVVGEEGRKIFTKATVFNQNNEIVATLKGLFIILEEKSKR